MKEAHSSQPGINITDYSTGEDISDRTLGESNTQAGDRGNVAYQDITVKDILKKKEKFGTAVRLVDGKRYRAAGGVN